MLNIKNPETHRLAHQLADLTGESLTTAVTVSLRERLERMKQTEPVEDRVSRVMELGRRWRDQADEVWAEDEDPTAFLYDEHGLPK